MGRLDPHPALPRCKALAADLRLIVNREPDYRIGKFAAPAIRACLQVSSMCLGYDASEGDKSSSISAADLIIVVDQLGVALEEAALV